MEIKLYINKNNCLEYEGPKPISVSQAIDLSITKWKLVSARIQQMIDDGEEYDHVYDGGIRTCGLCMMFYSNPGSESCEGCSVFNTTHSRYCESTPYEEWSSIVDALDIQGRLAVANREVEFLQQVKYDQNL